MAASARVVTQLRIAPRHPVPNRASKSAPLGSKTDAGRYGAGGANWPVGTRSAMIRVAIFGRLRRSGKSPAEAAPQHKCLTFAALSHYFHAIGAAGSLMTAVPILSARGSAGHTAWRRGRSRRLVRFTPRRRPTRPYCHRNRRRPLAACGPRPAAQPLHKVCVITQQNRCRNERDQSLR